MENAAESASTSSLAWRWAIEALASSTDLKASLLHDVIDQAEELPEDSRKNAGEMVALKCLEGLFGSLDCRGPNVVPSAQESKVGFDSSESCEDVVKRVFKETPKSALRVAGPDMSKWDVIPFIAQKRASMRCTLHQLKDSILDGTHPSADYLMQKSGLMPVNKPDSNFLNKDDLNEHCRRLDSSSSDPQAGKVKNKGSPLHLERERRPSVADPSSSSLLPSKRSIVDLTSENEARKLHGCDYGSANVKKLKHHYAHTLYSGQEEASSHGREVLEDSPERVMPQNERDGTDHLDEHQMTSVEDRIVEEEHFGSKKSGQNTTTDELHPVELSTPRYTISDPTEDDEMHGVISVEKEKDGNELPIEPKAFNKSPAVGNLHNITTSDSERNFGDDNHHANEMNTSSHSEFQPNTVTTPYPTEDDEMHDVISAKKATDGSELPIEPKAFDKSPVVGNRHNITTSDSFGDDNHHANEMNTSSHSEFQPNTVTTPYPTEDDEMHDVISAMKAKDGSDIEPKAFNKSPAVGNLHNITTSDSERNFGDDNHHANEMNTSSHSEFQPNTVTMPYPTEDDEMHDVISAKKAKDGSDIEPEAFSNSPAEGNLHNTITDDPERNFGDNNDHVNEMNTLSHSEFQPKIVSTDNDVGMNADEEEKDVLSDSDEYRSRRVDIAVKKKEFLSSQCMVDHDSFLLADGRELTVCVKCNQGGQLLSCDISDCPLVVHDKCLGSSARNNEEGDFICPFCSYSLAISEYLEAKKNAALAKKNVATFIRTGLGHQSIVIKEALQQKYRNPSRKAGVEGVAKVCEDVDLADKDNQVTLDGEQVDQVVDHEFPTVTDIANSNHRETKESPLRVAHELVDQECEGNVAEATEQHDICETLHEGQWPVEVADTEEGLQYQTDDNEEEPSYAINTEGDDNDESIISRYSISFRRKYRQLVSSYFHSTTASGSALGATGWLRSASPRSAPGSGSAPSPLSKLNT